MHQELESKKTMNKTGYDQILQQLDKQLPLVAVVGAGPAGLRAAFDLAQTGHQVLLIERSPATGGLLPLLDHQYPNDHCGLCRMLPMIKRRAGSQFCLKKGFFHSNITVLTSTCLVGLEGRPGQFTLELEHTPTGIDQQACNLCLECIQACPQVVADPACQGPFERKAIFLPNPLQVPASLAIDWQACDRCAKCVDACPNAAIDLEPRVEKFALEKVDGLIWAAGPGLYDPSTSDLYGLGQLPNVVTALGFERMLTRGGPVQGGLTRPSDKGTVGKIAWIQCVGSRNLMIGAEHCSSACCMFALKQALLARDRLGPDLETTIFYMDMRTFGRDYQRYLDMALEKGVRLVRCRVHSLEPADDSGTLQIGFSQPGRGRAEEKFDLAVLSTGQDPKAALPQFLQPAPEGVLVLESARFFKDISETIVEAGAAAGKMAAMVRDLGKVGSGLKAAENETSFFSKPPHVLVALVADSMAGLAGLDLAELERQVAVLAGSHQVMKLASFLGPEGQQELAARWNRDAFNRLVLVGGHDYGLWPQTHRTLRDLEIMPEMVEFVGLSASRLQAEPDGLTAAVEMIAMALARLVRRQPVCLESRKICSQALVIGAGPAGLSAAGNLAAQGTKVVLVEKQKELGGNLAQIFQPDLRQHLEQLKRQVESLPEVTIYRQGQVVESKGRCGNFTSRIRLDDGRETEVDHGVVIIATGGRQAATDAYQLGRSEKIITQFELEKMLSGKLGEQPPPGQVVMIQCAGSRQKGRNYCSRICCVKALTNAVELKRIWRQTRICVFYRDIMTEGPLEALYTQARKNGVLFLPFDPADPPQVEIEDGCPLVRGRDAYLDQEVVFRPDYLVLSTGLEPNANTDLAAMFQLETTPEGFIREADYKWRPVETIRAGVLVCGLARAPVRAAMAMDQGVAAAQRALEILKNVRLEPERLTARVRAALCSRCHLCIPACPYGARFVEKETGLVQVDAAACQGCGTCAAVCPNKATVMGDFEDGAIMDAIEAAL